MIAVSTLACIAATCVQGEDKAPEKVPTIVKLRAYSTEGGSGKRAKEPVSEFQGFVVEKNKILLTSYRQLIDPSTGALLPVIEAERVEKKKKDRKVSPVSIIAVEPTLNFAILKIDDGKKLDASKICPREEIVVDQSVHAITGFKNGSPVFSSGKITDLNSMECYQESMTATMLQAAIEIPDSSLGGPVFNDKGEVVALHSGYIKRASETEEHTGPEIEDGKIHILPIFLIFNIYESVKLKGNMKSPWTGFSVRALTETEQKVFPHGRFLGGVGIDHVWEGGPAQKLGVRKGDLLVGFSYYPTKTVAAFQKWLYMYGVDFKVKLHFIRDRSEYYAIDYTIEERPDWAKPR